MGTSKFDIADYLDSKEMIAEYLNTVLEEGDNTDVINAIGHIAEAIGMTKISEETGLSRPSLNKALSDRAKPQFETMMKVLKAIGGQIQVTVVPTRKLHAISNVRKQSAVSLKTFAVDRAMGTQPTE